MPCSALSAALGLECRDLAGGIKAIYVADFQIALYDGLTLAAGVIDGVPADITFFRYDVRPESTSFTTTVTNEPGGSAGYTTELAVTLNGLTTAQADELEVLIGTRFHCAVLDANDVVHCFGLQNGCTVTGATAVSGQARSDLRGFTLTINAAEKEFAQGITASASSIAANWPFDSVDGGTGIVSVTNPA